jgi:hypothetical protein
VLVSVEARDGLHVCPARVLDAFSCGLREAGLRVAEPHLATAFEVRELTSTWASRLGIPERRSAWLLNARARSD